MGLVVKFNKEYHHQNCIKTQVLPSGGLVIELSLDTEHYQLEVDNARPIVTLDGTSLAVPGRCQIH